MRVSVRVLWRVGVVLLVSAVVLAAAGWWLPAAGLMWPLGWLAGRWSSRAEATVLRVELAATRTELDRANARVAALEDEQVNRWDTTHPGPPVVARPDWPSRNRNSNTRDASPSHTTTPA
ncbi:hypothetical protein [Micromonospora wenchangensis]|uniref:hypothetical protein n=1 Tax=Micromonospora wenchangensis TaxID=1185415 RepID=UPI00382895E0